MFRIDGVEFKNNRRIRKWVYIVANTAAKAAVCQIETCYLYSEDTLKPPETGATWERSRLSKIFERIIHLRNRKMDFSNL